MQHPSKTPTSKAQADVQAYAAKVTRPRSRLGLWERQIFELLALGVPYRQVQVFLAERGTTVDVSALHRFTHAKKRAGLLAQVQARLQQAPAPVALPASLQARPPEVLKLAPQKPPAAAAAPARAPVLAPAPPAPGRLPKFTWNPDRFDMKDLK